MLKPGISTKVLDDFNLKESIDLAAEIGYEVIELWINDLEGSGMTPVEVRDYLRAKQLDCTVHLHYEDLNLTSFNEVIRAESRKVTLTGIRLAGEVQARTAVIHPGKQSSEPDTLQQSWDMQVQVFTDLAKEAERYQVRLGVENMEKTTKYLLVEPADVQKLVRAVNSPYLGVTLDLAHSYTVGQVDLFVHSLEVPVFNVHISQGSNMKMHVPLYDSWGENNYQQVLPVLKDRYAGPLIIEGYQQGRSEQVARESFVYLQHLLQSV